MKHWSKNKHKILIFLCTFALFAGAFLFPQATQAQANVAPPAVHAEIMGSLLRIDATDGFYPIEAVFINGRRFNFRVDSALMIDISGYIVSGDTIAVYAVDFAGNVSNTVLLTPPPPMQPPQPNNLTPEGQGQVIDHATNEDNIEFLTINTPAGNTFFLVIDHTRADNNVYFLNAVTEWDLLTLAYNAELPAPPQFSQPPPPPPVVQEVAPEPEPEPIEDSGNSNMGMVIFMLVAGVGVFGAAYYFKIVKPKQDKLAEEGLDDDDFDGDFTDDDVDVIDINDDSADSDSENENE